MKRFLEKDIDNGILVLRIGLGLTILWFGISQFLDPIYWSGYLPIWAVNQNLIETITLVYLNAIFETITALLILFNKYAKIISALLTIHMLVIAIELGGVFNEIAMRDFGILIGFLALFYMSENKKFFKKRNNK